MNIGQAAQASGLSAKMIRYYEDTGLIPAAGRTMAGYREYNEKEGAHSALHPARTPARGPGAKHPPIPCFVAGPKPDERGSQKRFPLAHVTVLDRKLADLRAMRRTLQHLISHCRGDERPDCPILDDLAGQSTELLIEDTRPSLN